MFAVALACCLAWGSHAAASTSAPLAALDKQLGSLANANLWSGMAYITKGMPTETVIGVLTHVPTNNRIVEIRRKTNLLKGLRSGDPGAQRENAIRPSLCNRLEHQAVHSRQSVSAA